MTRQASLPRMTRSQLLERARARVGEDGRRILEQALEAEGRDALSKGGDQTVTEHQKRAVEAMLERRAAGEPLQYVLGTWGFRRLHLFVDPRVLIPRPETE